MCSKTRPNAKPETVRCQQKKMIMKYITILIIILILPSCENKGTQINSIETFDEKLQLIEEYDISKIDSLQKLLIGTKLDNYQFVDLRGNEIDIKSIKKPIFLEATASWCKPCKALTPALNEVVEQYHEQIEFILLTHDTQEKAEIFSKGLHPKIKLIPSKSKQDPNSLNKLDVGGFKQIFPFPTTYFINSDKFISEIKWGAPVPKDDSEQELIRVKELNVQELSELIEKII